MDMMTKTAILKLDEPAYRGEPMPDGLSQPEQLYFQTVRLIYSRYRRGDLTRQQAVNEKQRAVKALDEGELIYRQHLHHTELHRAFEREFHKSGTSCKKSAECEFYNIMVGLMEGKSDV